MPPFLDYGNQSIPFGSHHQPNDSRFHKLIEVCAGLVEVLASGPFPISIIFILFCISKNSASVGFESSASIASFIMISSALAFKQNSISLTLVSNNAYLSFSASRNLYHRLYKEYLFTEKVSIFSLCHS